MQFSNRILIPNILDSNHINTPKLEHVCVMYGHRDQSLFSIDKDENTHETSTTTLSHSMLVNGLCDFDTSQVTLLNKF